MHRTNSGAILRHMRIMELQFSVAMEAKGNCSQSIAIAMRKRRDILGGIFFTSMCGATARDFWAVYGCDACFDGIHG